MTCKHADQLHSSKPAAENRSASPHGQIPSGEQHSLRRSILYSAQAQSVTGVWTRGLMLCLLILSCRAHGTMAGEELLPAVTEPPPELNVPEFYTRYISADGYPIVASSRVNDYALREAAYLIRLMLAKRPDVRDAMIGSGSRMSIIAWNEYTTDLPEWVWMGDAKHDGREAEGVSAKNFWDARARGMGGSETDPYCSCGEENLLGYPGDPYSTECILIHEFAHNIHLRGLSRTDPSFDKRLQATWQTAMAAGLWKGKYASVNHAEYFAEGVQSWFDNNRENDHDHNHVNTREELIEYDPGLADLCREVFGDTELRYQKPAQRLHGHLDGYDPAKAPEFVWPERLHEAKEKIRRQAESRSNPATANEPDGI